MKDLSSRKFALGHWWSPWAVLAVSLAGTFWLWASVRDADLQKNRARFSVRTEILRHRIIDQFEGAGNLLAGGAGLFDAAGKVGRNDWHMYVQALRVDENYPGIQGVGLSRVAGIIKKHGGTVSAFSEGEGKGDEFTFSLPNR